MDPAGLGRSSGSSRGEGLLAELDETVLARETLPTLRGHPGWIDASGRTTAGSRAVRVRAISRPRYPQVLRGSGQRDRLVGVGHVRANRVGAGCARRVGGLAATRSTVSGSAGVVDHVGPRALVTDRIRFNHVPTKKRDPPLEPRVPLRSVLLKLE